MRALLALALVLATASAAHAGGRPPGRTQPHDVETVVVTERYGSETLMADLVYLGFNMIAMSAVEDSDDGTQMSVMGVGAAIYAFGSPYVHLRNDNTSGAVSSLTLRVGLPLVLGYGAYAAAGGPCGEDELLCGSDIAAVLGASLGAIAAMAIDHGWVAKKRVARTYVYSGLTPSLQVTDDRVSLSLGGSF